MHVLATVLIILIGKSIAAFAIVLLFRYPVRTALTISASLAQIGEFSFILAGLGILLGLLPEEGRSLILAGALLSITLNPLAFAAVDPIDRWIQRHPKLLDLLERPAGELVELPAGVDEASLRDHVVLIGYGRVGGTIGDALTRHDIPYVVVERDRVVADGLRRRGVPAVYGDAARPGILAHVHLETARLLVISAPDPYHARRIIELAREANPGVATVVRTHSVAELAYLERLGVSRAVMGERELAFGMAHYALRNLGFTDNQADETIDTIRGRAVFAGPERRSTPRATARGK